MILHFYNHITTPQQGGSVSILDRVFSGLTQAGQIPPHLANEVYRGFQSTANSFDQQVHQKNQQKGGAGLTVQELETYTANMLLGIVQQLIQPVAPNYGGVPGYSSGIASNVQQAGQPATYSRQSTVVQPTQTQTTTQTGPAPLAANIEVVYPMEETGIFANSSTRLGETVKKRIAQNYYTFDKRIGTVTQDGKTDFYIVIDMELDGTQFTFDSDQSVVGALDSLVDRQELDCPSLWIIDYGRLLPLNISQEQYLKHTKVLRDIYLKQLGNSTNVVDQVAALRHLIPALNRIDITDAMTLERWMLRIINKSLNKYGRHYEMNITSLEVPSLDKFLNVICKTDMHETKLTRLQRTEGFERLLTATIDDLVSWLLDNGSYGAIIIGDEHEQVDTYLNCCSVLATVKHGDTVYNKSGFNTASTVVQDLLVEEMRSVTLVGELRTIGVINMGIGGTLDEMDLAGSGFCKPTDVAGTAKFTMEVLQSKGIVPDVMIGVEGGELARMWVMGRSLDGWWYMKR